MAKNGLLSISLLLLALVLQCHCQERKVYIVYMGERPHGGMAVASSHHALLQNLLESTSSAEESLVYSYGRSFRGFAAKLSDDEAKRLSEMEGVVAVFPSKKLELQTTRSWDFMGFSINYAANYAQGDVIVGLLDTGVWPESASFDDVDMGPPPAKWKGACIGQNFTCNNKLIGARYYNSQNMTTPLDIISPRDSEGHGTHTASTAAGALVPGANYFGLANGTARGGAPGARIAVYKVCWSTGCQDADILAAFDDAIADGVNVISVSLGGYRAYPYFEDSIAIGSFHAMKKGILTSNSACNAGPYPVSVCNYSPWSLTVAASSIDRKFISRVVLGNGLVFQGLAVNNFDLNGTLYHLIWGGDAANFSAGANSELASYCSYGTLSSTRVHGKIVLCDSVDEGSGILEAKAVGAIWSYSYADPLSWDFPATWISREDGQKIFDYIKTSNYPIATILVSETPKDILAPMVADFSSRGPNPITPSILKPDITAPGVSILASWSPISPPSITFTDTRSVNFNVISGTSMSTPHASGAAAYVKAAHPNWSPAAIKSALMTTATPMDPRKHEDLEFAYGAGHINPVKAVKPGLVFDASEADYANFLCKQGYNSTALRLVTGDNSSCNSTELGRAWDLNYPSFSLAVVDGKPIMGVFTRTVTNVGSTGSTYTASVIMPAVCTVKVEPSTLSFSASGEKKTFKVTVSGLKDVDVTNLPITSGAIIWTDGTHTVRTPIVVYTVLPGSNYGSHSMPAKKANFFGLSRNRNSRLGMYVRN